jgi:23S rRNA pseudouridine1911/1915/1917 synthase
MSHRIVGDPIYGLNENFVDDFLSHKVEKSKRLETTGASRLMLHAYYLEFTFLKRTYVFCSKQEFC